jgi:hypothetical protein
MPLPRSARQGSTKGQIMKPTVGRIVHYVPVYAPQMGESEEPLPAIIIAVLADDQCRLGVFGSTSYTVVSPVPHIEPDTYGRPVPGAWFWPPRVSNF